MWRSSKLPKNIFYEYFEVFWWSANVASELTSLCLNLIMSSSFFTNLLHSGVFFWLFDIWSIIGSMTPWPLQPSTTPPLSHQPPTNICASTITTNSHHSASPWPQVLGLMLTATCTIFLPKWSGGNSNSKLWPLISQHFLNRNACCLGE